MQFVKYALCGSIATGINTLVLFLMAWLIFPCLTESDPVVRCLAALGYVIDVPDIEESVRAVRTMLCSVPAYLISSVVCYALNVIFVFKRGRHGRLLEIALFLGASSGATVLGTFVAGILVYTFGMDFTYAVVCNIVTSVLINYVARKKFVFNG